ncbi:MAG: UvrD-helicase domain-containing protein, partial [Tepidanaerobacter sp.]|nr:UvrD-helicase domain-containing protein [Tepidanaerobacter sp.]
MDFLQDLNSQQRKAVTHPAGPLLVLAGAGSGKTRVLTYRIAYLIKNQAVNPRNIIAITFTNKAAQEMKERLQQLLPSVNDILVSTFHSACVRFLRFDIDKLGYNRNFIIFDTQDSQALIKECLQALNIDEKKFAPAAVLNYISRAKDRLLEPSKCLDNAKDIREKTMATLYELYQRRLKEHNALDFDDIIVKTVQLFKEFPAVLSYYQKRFLHILVDEYQDTNLAQYELVRMMAAKHRNLCVVGDDDQSIYAFRGADIRNILEFEQDFPDATVIRLEQNYRSTKTILNAANDVIDNNFARKKKRLWTDNGEGEKINLVTLEDEGQEAYFIAQEINNRIFRDNLNYKDFAVLYRTNAQSRVLEEVMVRMRLPYKIIGGLRFYQRKEIKDILAYLRVIANPSDDVSLLRIINVPKRGIGTTTVDRLKAAAEERNQSIFDIIMD